MYRLLCKSFLVISIFLISFLVFIMGEPFPVNAGTYWNVLDVNEGDFIVCDVMPHDEMGPSSDFVVRISYYFTDAGNGNMKMEWTGSLKAEMMPPTSVEGSVVGTRDQLLAIASQHILTQQWEPMQQLIVAFLTLPFVGVLPWYGTSLSLDELTIEQTEFLIGQRSVQGHMLSIDSLWSNYPPTAPPDVIAGMQGADMSNVSIWVSSGIPFPISVSVSSDHNPSSNVTLDLVEYKTQS